VRRILSLAILLLVASSALARRGGSSRGGGGGVSHSGSMGTGGYRSGGFGGGYRGSSSSFYRSGFRSGFYGSGFRYNNYPRYSFGFGYYPGFYSGFGYDYGYGSPWVDNYYPSGGYVSAPVYYESAPQSAPVVINEYYRPPAAQTRVRDYSNGGYGAEPTAQSRVRDYSNGGYGIEPAPQPASAPAKKPDFWLIAFPNGSVVLAVAYWTNHDILHYVTRTKEQKQIPISAIDRDLTDQLNHERGLEFRIPK
jgi:hypothetical protein